MAQRFNADDSDPSGSTRACACGRPARYAGRRPKTFITLLGPLTLERAYHHCGACRTGVCPRDQALGMEGTSLSPATTRLVGLTAAEVSFAKTSELLAVLAGVGVETRQVERCAEALGREVADDERAVTEQTAPNSMLQLPPGTPSPPRRFAVGGQERALTGRPGWRGGSRTRARSGRRRGWPHHRPAFGGASSPGSPPQSNPRRPARPAPGAVARRASAPVSR